MSTGDISGYGCMFVHPKTGESYWWILPYVNTELFNKVLADFAREFSLGADKRIFGCGSPVGIPVKI